jgi:hypothetical protein
MLAAGLGVSPRAACYAQGRAEPKASPPIRVTRPLTHHSRLPADAWCPAGAGRLLSKSGARQRPPAPFRRSSFGAGALVYRFVPALQVPAGFRDLHIRPAGEIHSRQRRRIGDGETLAGDKGVVGQLAIEFGEEAAQPGDRCRADEPP